MKWVIGCLQKRDFKLHKLFHEIMLFFFFLLVANVHAFGRCPGKCLSLVSTVGCCVQIPWKNIFFKYSFHTLIALIKNRQIILLEHSWEFHSVFRAFCECVIVVSLPQPWIWCSLLLRKGIEKSVPVLYINSIAQRKHHGA